MSSRIWEGKCGLEQVSFKSNYIGEYTCIFIGINESRMSIYVFRPMTYPQRSCVQILVATSMEFDPLITKISILLIENNEYR